MEKTGEIGASISRMESISTFITSRMHFTFQSITPTVSRKFLKLHPYFLQHYDLFVQRFEVADYKVYMDQLTRNEKMMMFAAWFDGKLSEFIETMSVEQATKYIELPEQRQYYLFTLWLEKDVTGEYHERTGEFPDKSRRDETLAIEAGVSESKV